MSDGILNSVVNITQNRDVNSLEYSLVSTIHEFITCDEITIFKSSNQADNFTLVKSVSLIRSLSGEFKWLENIEVRDPCSEVLQCLSLEKSHIQTTKNGKEQHWFPIAIQENAIGAIFINSSPLPKNKTELLHAFCRIYQNYLTILNENERDKLTGLLNRQTFERRIHELMNRQQASLDTREQFIDERLSDNNEAAWLAILDIDHFKQINDSYGHVCGDEVLLVFAQKMMKFFRTSDLLFRYGGEEFIIVFGATTLDSVRNKLSQFLQHIQESRFPFVEDLSFSAGFCHIDSSNFPMHLIEKADKALYHAKQNGRKQIVHFGDIEDKFTHSAKSIHGEIDLF